MADTFTTNLNMTKPEVGASTDTWGTKLNTDLDTLDAIFKSDGTGTAVGLNLTGKSFVATAGNISFKDATDATKIAKFDASTIATATTRTYVFPNANGTFYLVGQAIDSTVIGGTTPAAGTFTALTLTQDYKENVLTANTSTGYTIALTNGTVQILTLTGNCTYTFPTATAGKSFILFQKQDGTGSRTVTWPAAVKWPGGTAPTITSTASKMDIFSFFSDGTNWYGVTVAQNY